MQNLFTRSKTEPSLRAEIDIHSIDYDFPQAAKPPMVKSRSDTTQAAPMPGKQDKPVLSTAAFSCSPATNAPSFQARSSSSGSSQRAADGKEQTATKQAAKDATTERSGPHRDVLSPAAELARKNIVIKHYLEAIGMRDVKAVKNSIADEIRYIALDHQTMKTALWFAINSKTAAMIDLIVPVTSHSAKLDVMMLMLKLKAGQRAALKPGVDAIMKSYESQETNSRPCSHTEKAQAKRVRNYLD